MRNAARLSLVASLLTLALLAPGGRASAASDRLPDLAMAKLRHIGTTKTADGRRLLRFSAIIVNVGEGPFELRSRRADGSSRWSTRQVIVDDAGGSRSVATPSVKLVYEGDGHDHWHVKDLEQYRLVPLRSARPDRIGQKVGFCFFDNYEYDLMTPLRAGCSDADILAHVRAAVSHKPVQSDFEGRLYKGGSLRIMAQIGG